MSEQKRLLIVDDDKNNLLALSKVFDKEGLNVITALSGKEALEICRNFTVDIVLTDMRMPSIDGMQLLELISDVSPDSEVVLMTAYGTVESAVEAMKKGAYDFVEKPVKRAAIVKTVNKALEKHALVIENKNLKRRLDSVEKRQLAGNSPIFRKTCELAEQAAPSVATILITGESGTGKEVIARYIHENSSRSNKPFVAVNCAALPESILESELFGYEEGAFTGAVKQRDGRFSLADGGTIFLDEIGEIPLQLQVKLLRVLQEKEIEPLGGHVKKVDVRVLAATHRNLEKEIKNGNFREDLYYRLNVIVVNMPPLRQRIDDIPILADLFIHRYAKLNEKNIKGISKESLEILTGYFWPGNVRELENVIERAVVLCKTDVIEKNDIPEKIISDERYQNQLLINVGTPLEEIELRVIRETLKHTGGDKSRAAALLGIATRTIYRKLDAPS
ncbi:MAG: sigma-54-dependent Fis family transcriptional regulator [Deltaproteobacteria bacterium]|nr:sigma-54-dependent Fis family transcriptional regulator [Deltaproteobacteria bacterium]